MEITLEKNVLKYFFDLNIELNYRNTKFSQSYFKMELKFQVLKVTVIEVMFRCHCRMCAIFCDVYRVKYISIVTVNTHPHVTHLKSVTVKIMLNYNFSVAEKLI